MQVASDIPFPELVKNKAVMCKVIPMFNMMHNQHLTEDEGISLIDLAYRICTNDFPTPKKTEPSVIYAKTGQTVVQAIREHFDSRPFKLIFNGCTIEITAGMNSTKALMVGMEAAMGLPAKQEPLKSSKVEKVETKEPTPVATPSIDPAPAAETGKPPLPPVIADDDDDEDPQPQLKTYEVNPGEPVSRAVARVWELRPARLFVGGHSVIITAEMSVVDAQIEVADVTGIDGNTADVTTDGQQLRGAADEAPAPVILRGAEERPYAVAQFEYPIPVDDSEYNISHDRNSGAEFIRTERAVWLDGYPYRISCVPFDDMMNTQLMFYVHCKERPSQAMFDLYHRLFREHTHKVHVRRTHFTQDGSDIITNEYCSWRPREASTTSTPHIVSTVMDALGLNARWEPGARYRIRYWDTNVNAINHRYYSQRPSDDALTVLRHPKMKPVIQTRPSGV